MESLPGNTDLSSYIKSDTKLTPLTLSLNRPIIVLATNEVSDEILFRNGLTQNILVLYDLFETIGYNSYLYQYNSNSQIEKKAFLNNYKILASNDILKNKIQIKLFIEIGMSIDSTTRSYLRSNGTKIVKLYLGNILNIDIETIQNFKSMFFSHHLVGEIDEIWTSPHYKQHIDYAAVLNRVEIKNSKIVPYVWDSCFITQYCSRNEIEWVAPQDWKFQDIVIMDPNISFQKCYFYSLLLIETFSKKYNEWQGKVHIINGDRLKIEMNSNNLVLPSLTLFQNNRIILHNRKNIHTILKEHRSACFITHQWNNDFNYMTLELMHSNFPILHNSEGWSNFGYYYSINDWDNAIEIFKNALQNHKQNLNIYRSHSANLIWKHSIYNPEIQAEWTSII
jgi:hypothetical protein